MLPFGHAEFFDVFARYNAAVWPAPVVAYAFGALIVAAALRGRRAADNAATLLLAAGWFWTGIVYHWLHFTAINGAAWLFGALYVIEALLLLWFGCRHRMQFGSVRGLNGVMGLLFIAYAAVIYPLLGLALGHAYPHVPTFGITPCPLTIFTLGVFLLARRLPPTLLVVPVLWSLVGGSAALLLSVPQDWFLLAGGATAVFLYWRSRQGRMTAL